MNLWLKCSLVNRFEILSLILLFLANHLNMQNLGISSVSTVLWRSTSETV